MHVSLQSLHKSSVEFLWVSFVLVLAWRLPAVLQLRAFKGTLMETLTLTVIFFFIVLIFLSDVRL